MKLTVGIATSGRRELSGALIHRFARQSRLPDEVIVCPASENDIDENVGEGLPFPVRIVRGRPGLPAQRNTIMRAATQADALLFFDDDFIPADTFIERCIETFEAHPDVMIVTGHVLADGINTAGFDTGDAETFLARDVEPERDGMHETYGGYGCNMAVRMAPVREHDVTFDEDLPLYGWLEDIDFSRRIALYGRIVRTQRCRGVHLGVKKGRTSGVRFGYSQFANPIHMVRKGSVTVSYSAKAMARNLLANIARSFAPEPWVDRRGRLKGNLHALMDLARGSLHPTKILSMK